MPGASTICFISLLAASTACYISNCPIGGKRAVMDIGNRKCMPCGPDNKGRCFGPSICCSEELGCYIGTSESARCLEESFLSSPCEASGRVCGLEEDGHCAAPGICCDEESCHMDAICSQGEIYSSHLDGGMSTQGEFVLRLLHLADRQSERK